MHVARHSYAVIQISLGTDIYTVSKMLTHKNVTTTQIYADLVNSKKRETANKISLKWKHYSKDNLYYTTKIVQIIFDEGVS